MKACAPGKLVLSGAYSVLEGAPAIVSAVDRYVCCDSDRPAPQPTPEVRAALPEGPAPDFDASALRADGRKLGLGSSAAILVASLAAADPRSFDTETSLRRAIAERALLAHQEAQGGGSGIDVAASTWGGTLIAKRRADASLELEHVALPEGLVVEVWASGVPASTAEFLSRVAQFRMRSPREYTALFGELGAAAAAAATALRGGKIPELLKNIRTQSVGFGALGRAAGVPIITPEVHELAECAGPYPAAVLPSGAGGGDIVLWLSSAPSPSCFRARAEALGHRLIPLTLHARGVHRCAPEGSSPRGS